MDLTADRRLWTRLRNSGGWLTRAWDLGQSMRPAHAADGELFVLGTATFDPWHVTAHLDLASRSGALPGLRPTLLRWTPPLDGPAHLRHGVDELARGGKAPIFIVAPNMLAETELEKLADARRRGSTIYAVSGGQDDLTDLSHECVVVTPDSDHLVANLGGSFEVATHLVSVGAGTPPTASKTAARGSAGRILLPWQIRRRRASSCEPETSSTPAISSL